ncbi:MAG: tRNA pseudouridine synthase, TruD family [Halonotius sp. J07HN4]|nr:MAG: tRNA pseudouridine synthase, TruD family [Halonotius sp. J07HN4]
MRESHPIEQAVGIDYYISDADGIGGRLRVEPADFRVEEIENFEPEPLDADPGAYPEILLRATLRSWDTNDFAGRLSDALEVSRERVSWAGTKDKHAVTTQLFSVSSGDPDAIADLDIRGAEIEVLGRTGRPISFGDLHGNRFQIRVREADDGADNRIGEVTDDLRAFGGNKNDGENDTAVAGIPNWFGQQRFGSRRPVTHEVGLRIVAGNWREAVLAYVANPFNAEPEKTQTARQFVADEATNDDPDWTACLDEMPGQLGYERSMLHRLAENGASSPADFRHALEAVPWNLQQLFVNAAQSSLFNRILSERLARGLPFDRPVAGDVCCFADNDAPDGLYAPDTDRLQRVSGSRVGVMERHCDRGRAFVTAPLVGAETELADGEPGEIEREILADVGVEPSDFELPGEFSSTGTRRAILVRTELGVDPETLTFSFALPSGSYATAVLREYQKGGPLK